MVMALALKSKTGCFNCRRRRIKCDEIHPSCLRCQKTGLQCVWPPRGTISSAYLQSNTTIGNTYASLFLQNENVDFKLELSLGIPSSCPASCISSGYPQFRNQDEHHNLVKLSGFLSMLKLDRATANPREANFEFTVALQEPWVRDAMLAFAGFINGPCDRDSIWNNVLPYYTSATRNLQHYVAGQLDEARLEQLLIASLFLGLIEINNPQNEIFPLLHFEAVGRILEALHQLQAHRIISTAAQRFHRIALESYLYHIAIQSLYYPQTDRYPTLSANYEPAHELATTSAKNNIITKLDLNIYVALLKLTRLARIETPDVNQQVHATELSNRITQIDVMAASELKATPPINENNTDFLRMTLIGTSALAILCAKVMDRSLLAKSVELRPLVDTLLSRLDSIEPSRQWTGDFVWVLTIAACAVYTPNECQKFTRKVQQLSTGFWGNDLKRMKAVLKLVRSRRAILVQNTDRNGAGIEASDTLNILVNAGLSMN